MSRRGAPKIPDVSQVASWSGSKINSTLDRLERLDSALIDAFIDAGRGHERPSEYLTKGDPLSRRAQAISNAKAALRSEIHARYGPGAPSRLPRGFGPIRGRFLSHELIPPGGGDA